MAKQSNATSLDGQILLSLSELEPVDVLKCEISSKGALLDMGGKNSYLVSLPDFVTVISDMVKTGAGKSSRVRLPVGIVSIEESLQELTVIIYRKGEMRTVTHLEKKYRIPMPNVVLVANLKKEKVGVSPVWASHPHRCHFYATTKTQNEIPMVAGEISTGNPGFFPMPLPNFYGDNRMCFGQNQGVFNLPMEDLSGLEYYFTIVESSPFNNDLSPPKTGGRRNSDWFAHLETLTEFPYDILN